MESHFLWSCFCYQYICRSSSCSCFTSLSSFSPPNSIFACLDDASVFLLGCLFLPPSLVHFLLAVELVQAAQPALLLPSMSIFLLIQVRMDDSCPFRMMSLKTGQLFMAPLSPTGSCLPVPWTTQQLVSWRPRLFSADCLAQCPLDFKLYHLLGSAAAITSPTSSTLVMSSRSTKTPSLVQLLY